VQDNQSFSRQGTLRGLHYQLSPMAQAKLIRVIQGEIFDVAVDIRPHSPTYGKWVGLSLTSNTHDMIFIPEGFAHGFYVISEIALIQYKCSRFYSPQYERALLWNDPKINIHWPLIRHIPLVISEKDQKGFRFHELEFLLK